LEIASIGKSLCGHSVIRFHIYIMNLILLAFAFFFHPFYVSVSELNYNAQSKSMEITVRCFADDLEEALRSENRGLKVDLVQVPRQPLTDSAIARYMRKHFGVKADAAALSPNMVGAEMNDGYFWIYLEAPQATVPKQVEVHNTILYAQKKEQNNLHHVKVNNERKSYRLANPESSFTLDF